MITVVRTANIHDGKIDAAFAWAVKIAKYGRDKLGMNTQVARNIGGELYQLHWVSTYPSLADAEKATKASRRLWARPGSRACSSGRAFGTQYTKVWGKNRLNGVTGRPKRRIFPAG